MREREECVYLEYRRIYGQVRKVKLPSDLQDRVEKNLLRVAREKKAARDFLYRATMDPLDEDMCTGFAQLHYKNNYKNLVENASCRDPESLGLLAEQYLNGFGVEKDAKKAFLLALLAAREGALTGQFVLAMLYLNGGDAQEGICRLLYLARKGFSLALYSLGVLFSTVGDGRPEQPQIAAVWWIKAANKGNDLAQNQLGKCYRDGYGVQQDFQQATRWFELAARQGYLGAKIELKMLKQKKGFSNILTLSLRSWFPYFQSSA